MRFGYPGPTRFEREIRVRLTEESIQARPANRLMGGIQRLPAVAQADQGTPTRAGSRRRAGQGGQSRFPGLDLESVLGSIRHHRFDLPTVQSEELVIVSLVKPDYPPVAIEQGLEGRVELLALVNTRGLVEDVEILRSAGALLDGAASMAVRRCRFAPYRIGGRAQSVYANFKFNFTLLDR